MILHSELTSAENALSNAAATMVSASDRLPFVVTEITPVLLQEVKQLMARTAEGNKIFRLVFPWFLSRNILMVMDFQGRFGYGPAALFAPE
jgi:hypothetical protein